MSAWARSFENWADGDTACFKLFDQTPLAWDMVRPWAKSPREFTRRGGFALMASLALHDKKALNERFLELLPLVEEGAQDDRNFVKKGVNWALRSIGRRSPDLNTASIALARRLSLSKEAAPRWVGKDALHEFVRVNARAKPQATARKRHTSAR